MTNAQKRDARFHEANSVIVFNQKVHNAQPGSIGRLAGMVKCGLLVEVEREFITIETIENRHLNKVGVYLFIFQ